MTLAVEPMVNVGDWQIRVLPDGWTVKTLDGSLAAHYENTILITEGDAGGPHSHRGWSLCLITQCQIVQATAGRDKGGVFCVVAMDQRQERLLLADGKRRKVCPAKAQRSWAMYGS